MGRLRLSFSNVISVVALFLALGGAAYALQSDSVGSRHVKDSSLKSKDVKDEALKAKDVAVGTLTGDEIADASIGGADVAADSMSGSQIDESTLAGVTPSGPAGGVLRGSYPNPALDPTSVGTAQFKPLPHAKLVGSTQLFGDGIVTTVALGGPVTSEAMTFDNATDTLMVEVPGLYAISGYLIWDSAATGRRVVQVHVNGSNRIEDSREAVTTSRTAQSVSTVLELAEGDEITMRGQQTSGGDLTTAPLGAPDPELNVYWVGPAPGP